MIVKAAPRLATILWLWRVLVDERSSTRDEHVPLVGELHQSQSKVHLIEATPSHTLAMPMGEAESAMVVGIGCVKCVGQRNEW
jgi:hypothetical protein